MKLETLRDLYIDQLKDLYSAENQLVEALPKMAKAATSAQLRMAFEHHLEQTKNHVKRIEQVFQNLNGRPTGKTCKAMQGLVAEGSEAIKEDGPAEVKDAALIAAAQRVEHYEMAGYGTVRTFAQQLGETQAVTLLQQTLNEEGEADKKLTQIAESTVNVRAGASA